MHGLDESMLGRAEADRLLAEARMQVMKKLRLDGDDPDTASELSAESWEDAAARLVEVSLPQERQRIQALLDLIPDETETKTLELLRAMDELWQENPREKFIVFTTYLGSVDSLRRAIDDRFPDAGVDVLKGGDHGAKLAAERRFRRPDGPRVLICTAAGREGINLQFARVLFNHDLPWNPMDLEQRIGRIHRYGQNDTVQIYNLVAADTIEGRVFLLLEEKIQEVASALGKVDERGQVSEDLRSQILGQLGERLSYNHLYQEALRDPTLQRTAQELEVALGNASQAREVVSELFQDLEPFRLDDYREIDSQEGVARLVAFTREAALADGATIIDISATRFIVEPQGTDPVVLTADRDEAMADERLQLIGLEHPVVARALKKWSALPAGDRAVVVHGSAEQISSIWETRVQHPGGSIATRLFCISVGSRGATACTPYSPKLLASLSDASATESGIPQRDRALLATKAMPEALRSHLSTMGYLADGATYNARLVAWVEMVSS